MQNLAEKTVSTEIIYKGAVINVRKDDVILNGGLEKFREVVEHSGGVVILPMLDDNRVVLIKQWRHPVAQELIELPAGKLDLDEDPFDAAKRELEEETGYVAENWEYMGSFFSTPGFCDEKIHLYRATGLKYICMNPDEGENIEPFVADIQEAFEMVKSGKINDAKTIIGILRAVASR
jgi:ADP-ribose pyrophosphatase